MSIDQALTSQERLADLSLDQLRQLIGMVEYDRDQDHVPITNWDAVAWNVGNATHSALFFQPVYGMCDQHRRHGDGMVGVALEVADVDPLAVEDTGYAWTWSGRGPAS